MEVEITLKNYRCFADSHPATFTLAPGITAFVGANNAGKSTILRWFYECRHILSHMGGSGMADLVNGPAMAHFNTLAGEVSPYTDSNDRGMTFLFRAARIPPVRGAAVPDCVTTRVERPNTLRAELSTVGENPFPGPPGRVAERDDLLIRGNEVVPMEPWFTLLKSLANTLYIGSLRNALNAAHERSYYDLEIGTALISRWRTWRTGEDRAVRERAVDLCNEIARIFGLPELLVDASDNLKSLQVAVGRKSYKLHEMGDGIAQFIVVLMQAALRRPHWILIDEPENGLHPSLQLDFITALASYAKEGLLFATHSIGLARAAADRIYSVRKVGDAREVRALEATPRLAEFLGELGFSAYQELGFNRILLVEGPTDVKTIQQFLRLFHKEHEIVLLPLNGGSSIGPEAEDQLCELRRMPCELFAWIDSERSTPGEPLGHRRREFVDLCGRMNITCEVLERRAIENYFTDRAVRAALGEERSALGPFDKFAGGSGGWSKNQNWRIARHMTIEDLEGTDLGQFLSAL